MLWMHCIWRRPTGAVDYFCTCDDRFLRRTKALPDLRTTVVTPIELIGIIKSSLLKHDHSQRSLRKRSPPLPRTGHCQHCSVP